MILAAGLTPAWQQIMRFREFCLGEVNRAQEVHWCASGKVINVGMALAALGMSSHTLSPAGGWSGGELKAEFARRGFAAAWTRVQTPTRVCTTLLTEFGDTTTELVENAGPITREELAEFCERYRNLAGDAEMAVLTGSLPQGAPVTFYRDLLAATRCPVVLDARGPELLAALEHRPLVVKPNRDELALTVMRPLPDRASVVSAMRELIDHGARSVVVTQGKNSGWLMEGKRVIELTPPAVQPVVNPIGCGDCLAAGLAAGLARGDSLVDAVRQGMAAAAENLRHLLPARLAPEAVAGWKKRIGPGISIVE